MNRSLHVTAAMRDTNLSDPEMQAVVVFIGPFLNSATIDITPQMQAILDLKPKFKAALEALGVFE